MRRWLLGTFLFSDQLVPLSLPSSSSTPRFHQSVLDPLLSFFEQVLLCGTEETETNDKDITKKEREEPGQRRTLEEESNRHTAPLLENVLAEWIGLCNKA